MYYYIHTLLKAIHIQCITFKSNENLPRYRLWVYHTIPKSKLMVIKIAICIDHCPIMVFLPHGSTDKTGQPGKVIAFLIWASIPKER